MRENTDDVLAGALEKILFSESELNEIKVAIQDFATGKINASQFKKILILSKRKTLEETLDLFPFYLKQSPANESLSNITGIKDKDKEYKLKEKDEFLTEIAPRIVTIHENLERLQRKKKGFYQQQKYYLNKIDGINADAERAYSEKRYGNFIELKYLSIGWLCKFLYYKLFNKKISKKNRLNLYETIITIEREIDEKFNVTKELNTWRIMRNNVAHDHAKIDEKTASSAKEFFDDLSNKLKKAFNCL